MPGVTVEGWCMELELDLPSPPSLAAIACVLLPPPLLSLSPIFSVFARLAAFASSVWPMCPRHP